MLEAAEALLGQVELLSQPPTNAQSFLVIDDYGRGKLLPITLLAASKYISIAPGTHAASGLAFKVCFGLTRSSTSGF